MDAVFSSEHIYAVVRDFCAAGLVPMVIWLCFSALISRSLGPSRNFESEASHNVMAEPIADPPVRFPRPPELGIHLAEAIHSYRMEHDEIR